MPERGRETPSEMETATGKRRRGPHGGGGGGGEEQNPRRPRGEPEAVGEDQVKDDEVEEFFAILRRMRDASRCLAGSGSGAGGGARRREAAVKWRPAFAWEDFQPGADGSVKCDGAPEEGPQSRGLDLNADPDPEVPAVVSPGGEATAR